MMQQTLTPRVKTTYNRPQYNKVIGDIQRIETHRGCPHNHEYCLEPQINVDFPLPEITRNHVEILDMNFLCRKNVIDTIKELGSRRVNKRVVYYEAICGFDFRFITPEIVGALKENRFRNIRLAWDGGLGDQYDLKKIVKLFQREGFKNLSLFMIVNWKVPKWICERKLDIMKVWNVKVCDCCYDGGYRFATPMYWKGKEITEFRAKCRTHNHIINFGIDPDYPRYVKRGLIKLDIMKD